MRWVRLLIPLMAACATAPKQPQTPDSSGATIPAEALGEMFGNRGKDVVVLKEHGTFRYDAEGRKTYTYAIDYKIRAEGDVQGWSTISAEWSPWYQARPELTAVVTRRDGTQHTLDRSTVVEAPVASSHQDLYSDRRRVRAPLPGIEPGATVSQTIVYRDKRPFFEAGSVGVFYFGMRVPVRRSTVVLEVPTSLPLSFEVRGADLQPTDETKAGVRRIEFSTGPLPPIRPAERLLPGDAPRFPHVVFSTSESWAAVARRYAAIVADRLQGADISSMVEGIPKTLPKETLISALLARLHSQIRYTGMEFGQQAIVPWRPNETLARRFGDCKDKAAVLVAMLAHFEIEAHLALLRSGSTEDVLPGLPGLEGFNHAIVYIPGEPAIWIDATAEFAAVGELPVNVQGRNALIASDKTDGLTPIPATSPDQNRYSETREYYLSDFGPMRVVERTQGTGTMQLRLREQFGLASRSQVRSSLEGYARSAYKAERLQRFYLSRARDLAAPFSVEMEAIGAKVGYTAASDAFVQLRNGIMFSFLPDLIRYAALAGEEDAEPERVVARKLVEHREEDVVFPEPYSAEVVFKVVPPVGYTLRKLPEDRVFDLGPARYTSKFKKRPDDVVEARFFFTTGKRRLTPDELRRFVDGLREAWDQPITALEFDHRGSKHMAEGRFREGLTEYRHLVEVHPKSALHHARMAEALLRAGLGEPARRAARQAVSLDPGSSYAHFALGWVLQHDLFGRQHNVGFDRNGAIAAFRKVTELDPDNVDARVNLAVLLEHDQRGTRYRGAGLDDAIAEYLKIRDSEQRASVEQNLLIALYWSRRFDDLKRLSPDLKPSPLRDSMTLVAWVATDGVDRALEELRQMGIPPQVKNEIVDAAATSLAHLRLYDSAYALAKIAAQSAEDMVASQGRLAMLSRLASYQKQGRPPTDPASVVQKMLELLFTNEVERQDIGDLISVRSRGGSITEGLQGMAQAFSAFKRVIRSSGVPLEMVRDNVLAATRYTVEGSDRRGYRIQAVLVGPSGEKTSWWFVIKEKGQYRVRAVESSPYVLAEEALDRLQRGDEAGAEQWLDWARELVGYRSDMDPMTTHPFSALWRGVVTLPEQKRERKDLMKIAAATLIVDGAQRVRGIQILERMRKKARSPGVELRIDHALVMAYLAESDYVKALAAVRRLRKRTRTSDLAYVFEFQALYRSENYDEAMKIAAERLAANPSDILATHQLADVATSRGELAEAERLLRSLIDDGRASSTTYNNLAWLTLFTPKVEADAVDLALQANNMSRFTSPSSLHTLAALYAEEGRTKEAFQLLLKLMELRSEDEPQNADWYLLGRIMEHYDLVELAASAYRRVTPGNERPADSTFKLAQKRLDYLSEGRE